MHSLKSIYRSALKSDRAATWWLTALLGALALSLASPAFAAAAEAAAPAPVAPTGSNPNDYECQGQLSAGKHEGEGKPEGTPIQYLFKCDGQITGYQVQTQVPITGIEGQPAVTNYQNQPLKEAFSCSGAFPGYAVNCVGATTAEAYERITGEFEIGWKLCTEPRVDALLTVTYAYLEKGVITQAIAGPFDLGRPEGCPHTPQSGRNRLDAYQAPEPTTKHKHHKQRNRKGKGAGAKGRSRK
ncbi:MAG TPA: hypothetical protein VNV37_02600 [Solirubrobacteraceae bacterium]|jgi:hypothetical protein|nr:hypothetical protein [Solirubrobacteraceae bacterium]